MINPVIQYTTFERLTALLLSFRARKGVTPTGLGKVGSRGSLSDWDLFLLGAVSKLVATGGTYPFVCFFFFFLDVSGDRGGGRGEVEA